MDPARERELIQRAKRDPEAFGEIFDIYYDRMLGFVLRRTGDMDVSADITAEVFAKALKHIKGFNWRGIPLSAWLYRIAGNEVNMYFRKQKYLPKSLQMLIEAGYDPEDEQLVAERHQLEEQLARSEEERYVLDALATLSRPEQDLIVMRYFDGLKTRDIASILRKPDGTVRSMLSRTLSELRIAYEEIAQQNGRTRIIDSEGRRGLTLQTNEL